MKHTALRIGCIVSMLGPWVLQAAPATLVYEENFNQGIPGWEAVLPAGNWIGTPLWQFDINTGTIWENSNVYSDNANYSPSRAAAMLINQTPVPASNFTFTVRLRASDDDGCGLIFGYENSTTFYRVTFGLQNRTLWPFTGWNVDRMVNGEYTDLFGKGKPSLPYTAFTYTANRVFDVTVGLTNGLFSLTVVDDATNAPTVYNLVSNEKLPTGAAGRVGVFSWGMQTTTGDGLPNVGIRFMNPSLAPLPLTGNTNPLAVTWSTLVTPRGDGTTDLPGNPIWAMAMTSTGPNGRLRETSGYFKGSDNTATGTTNFAAATAVSGNVNWTNYVCSARFIPTDDDGFGLMLRFLDSSNWYRVAFRSQNSTSGAKQGVSMQKCVGGVFDQIMWDRTTYVYRQPNIPVDVYAQVLNNQIQLLIVSDPASATPAVYNLGPFAVSGPTVDHGKIGIFSWAQQSIDADWLRVEEVAGTGLQVVSTFGTPDPPVGLNDLPSGTVVTASVASVVSDLPGVRRLSTGFQGGGSVPASGATNSVTFTLNGLSLLTWNWRTEYQLNLSASSGGQAVTTAGAWVAAGSNVTITAQANAGYVFTGWSGDTAASTSNLTFTMNAPRTLMAHFEPDTDNDSLPDAWENLYFTNLSSNPTDDPDHDGVNNLDEYLRGTHPNFAETIAQTDGLISQWVNTQRDPGLAGALYVTNFGSGYRGAYDTGNGFRYGNDAAFIPSTNLDVNYDSFQSPIVVVRSNVWNEAWASNFSASIEFTVGDNDGNCFYFRYQNEQNWYRVTLCGEDPGTATYRPPLGLSVQARIKGFFTNVPVTTVSGPNYAAILDPWDGGGTPSGFKRVRLTLNGTNENFQVQVLPWNAFLGVPDFDENYKLVATFTDTNLTSGRLGFGFWGQGTLNSATPDTSTNGIPIPSGGLADAITLKSPADGSVVFSEDWETAALRDDLPSGWLNPYGKNDFYYGTWYVTAHGTIVQQANVGQTTSGTSFTPKADGDGPILLAPGTLGGNFMIEAAFHAFDDDGIGLVYDFTDTNNFSRLFFVAAGTPNGGLPAGLSVSQKSGGAWTDLLIGDTTFTYVPGRPFSLSLANINGVCRLVARDLDYPTNSATWQWSGKAPGAGARYGMTVYSSQDAHLLSMKTANLPSVITTPLDILGATFSGGQVHLNIAVPYGSHYDVLRAADVAGPYNPVATGLSSTQYAETPPAGVPSFYRLQQAP